MRAQLAPVALVALLTLWSPAANAETLSPQSASVIDHFASAVERAYSFERQHHPSIVAEIPPDTVLKMKLAVLHVEALVGGALDFTTLARDGKTKLIEANAFSVKSPLEADLQFLKNFYSSFLQPDIDQRSRDAEAKGIGDDVQALQHAQLEKAQVEALDRLRRFELKYGQGSAKLNVVELAENFWLQRMWIFKPQSDGPSPWEVVSGYSSTYLTTVQGQGQVVSVIEAGLRHYNFSYDPDLKSGLTSYATPRYWTAAFVIGDGRDGALRMPFRTAPRLGGSLSWGDLKVAYLHGDGNRWRLLVSRQMQLLPHLL